MGEFETKTSLARTAPDQNMAVKLGRSEKMTDLSFDQLAYLAGAQRRYWKNCFWRRRRQR